MRSWGSDVIDKSKWIDPSKTYTCGGKRVVNLQIVMHDSAGKEFTFPVKGSVVVREKPLKTRYCVWTLDGRGSVVSDNPHWNLIEK